MHYPPQNSFFAPHFRGGCSTRKRHFHVLPTRAQPHPIFINIIPGPKHQHAPPQKKNRVTATATYISSPFTNPIPGLKHQQTTRNATSVPSIIRNNQDPNTSRHKAGGAAPGLSCAACFEQLAGVLASCDAFPPMPSHRCLPTQPPQTVSEDRIR